MLSFSTRFWTAAIIGRRRDRMLRRKSRIAILADFAEERWPSMDLVAEMLAHHLVAEHGEEFEVELVRPRFVGFRPGRTGTLNKPLFNAVRLFNRFVVYPRWIARHRKRFDLFHIVDHSYSHLIHRLPAERCVVTCHDLDTFRCLLKPETERRSAAFRAMTARILDGFRRAGRVICGSNSTRDEILRNALIPADHLQVIYYGVDALFTDRPDGTADAEFTRLLAEHAAGNVYLLHVGGTQPRKRIDLLLRIFAAVSETMPGLSLVRVGGPLEDRVRKLAAELGVADRILELPFIDRRLLAAAYRHAAMLVIPSEAEGFGLPVIEAMACGTRVIASDIPVLREVGGEAAEYCAVGDIAGWSRAIVAAISAQTQPYDREGVRRAAQAQAARFSWSENATATAQIYRLMLGADEKCTPQEFRPAAIG
jgi:glycosyltransferase involved in cell wall biosynthesis